MSDTDRVLPVWRVIANGGLADKDGSRKLFLTLLATPCPSMGADAFSLSEWPDQIRRLVQETKLELCMRNPLNPQSSHSIKILLRFKDAFEKTGKIWSDINAMWVKSLLGEENNPGAWTELATDIGQSLIGEKRAVDFQRPDYLQLILDKSAMHTDGALMSERPDKNTQHAVFGALSVHQAQSAATEELHRAIRAIVKHVEGPLSIADDTESELAGAEQPASKKLDYQEAAFERYRELTLRLTTDREASFKLFEEIKELLDPTNDDYGLKPPGSAAYFPEIPAQEVLFEINEKGAEPKILGYTRKYDTHDYFLWPQRPASLPAVPQSDGKGPTDQRKPQPNQVEMEKQKVGSSIENARAMFFAIQSDPTLARLFGLAIDVEIYEDEVLKATDVHGLVHMAVDCKTQLAVGQQTLPTVATAAMLSKESNSHAVVGKLTSASPAKPAAIPFWPVSIFREMQIVAEWKRANRRSDPTERDEPKQELNVLFESLIDQENGIFLSYDQPGGQSRFEVTSLDFRHSIESKSWDRDRGQRLLSGGLAILDRLRANQIVRDLALLDAGKRQIAGQTGSANDWLVLHAEQLTVGRKLDVAVLKSGSAFSAIKWRSLMRRYVDFDFGAHDKEMESHLKKLVPSLGNLHPQETSFQLGTRMIPLAVKAEADKSEKKGDQANDKKDDPNANLERVAVDAIGEESVFQWTGAPVAIDVNSTNGSFEGYLPFPRKMDLPNADHGADMRPPPLRFGLPYVFRMRAAFVGGGSVDGDVALHGGDVEAVSSAETTIPYSKPTAGDDAVKPKRFLRHESIGEPILLLPFYLCDQSFDVMGYEQLDAAIIRSTLENPAAYDTASGPANAEQKATGFANEVKREIEGNYLGLDKRNTPSETVRIFLPPEVPPELVERHGEFDRSGPKTILRGGLLNAVFKPHRLPRSDSNTPVNSGFPVVVTERIDGLDSNGVIDRRRYYDPLKYENADLTGQSGIPVFKPGSAQTPDDREIGYLPDPAASTYCIRARRRGSDIYLAGSLTVDVREKETYPHTTPLAIRIRKKAVPSRQTGKAPSDINDIAAIRHDPVHLDSNGQIRPGGGICKVSLIEISLGAHDDFELEVTCLPTSEKLARNFALPETIAALLSRLQEVGDALPDDLTWIKGIIDSDTGEKMAFRMPADPVAYAGLGGQHVSAPANLHDIAASLLNSITKRWPLEELAAGRRLRVCHAVNMPVSQADWQTGTQVFRPTADKFVDPAKSLAQAKESDLAAYNDSDRFDALISAAVELDLAEVESFEIVVRTVGVDGRPLDDTRRARSPLSKRSGRWPKVIATDKQILKDHSDIRLAFASPLSVYGFNVDERGSVTLPRANATLLSVGNLPTHGTTGDRPDIFQPVTDIEGSGGDETPTRKTAIALYPLFVSAFNTSTLELAAALPTGTQAKDRQKNRRLLKIRRPYTFMDALARRLELSIVTVSRHASDFETAPRYVEGKKSPQSLFRRQQLISSQQKLTSTTIIEVSLPATRRPQPVDAKRPEPSFVIARETEALETRENRYSVHRQAKARIWLGRGWFSSGEDERLGLVLWPPDYRDLHPWALGQNIVKVGNRVMALSQRIGAEPREFQDSDIGPGGQYTTRWGGDPTRNDGDAITPAGAAERRKMKDMQKGYFIPANAFAELDEDNSEEDNPHVPLYVPHTRMPVPKRPDENKDGAPAAIEYLSVSLLTFVPCFDADREEWYVDVGLRTREAAEPFVRFGLVRYQANAIVEDIKVSEPVTVMMQLLPERRVTVTQHYPQYSNARPLAFTIKAQGPAGIGLRQYQIPPALVGKVGDEDWKKMQNELDIPQMRVALFWEYFREGVPYRIPVPVDGHEVWQLDYKDLEGPRLDVAEYEENRTNEYHAVDCAWSKTVALSQDDLQNMQDGELVVYLEEIERRMPASYPHEPISLATMFDPETFVDSGPRFIARLPLKGSWE